MSTQMSSDSSLPDFILLPKSTRNPQKYPTCRTVLSGCYSYSEQLSFQEWDNLSLSVSGFSHQQFSVEIHGSYYKYKGKERKKPRI